MTNLEYELARAELKLERMKLFCAKYPNDPEWNISLREAELEVEYRREGFKEDLRPTKSVDGAIAFLESHGYQVTKKG